MHNTKYKYIIENLGTCYRVLIIPSIKDNVNYRIGDEICAIMSEDSGYEGLKDILSTIQDYHLDNDFNG